MPDPAATATETEFVFRRLSEPFPFTATDTPAWQALAVVGGLLALAAATVLVSLYRSAWVFGERKRASPAGVVGFVLGILGALVAVAFGRIDDRRRGLWDFLAAGGRAALFAFPALLILVGRYTETDAAPLWWAFTGGTLVLAVALTVLMAVRDAQSVGPWWGFLIVPLRTVAYAVLAFCFLLPALQAWENSEKRSKVVVVIDVSPSVSATTDDLSANKLVKPRTRLDKVLDFLSDERVAFLQNLLKKNPVAVYRFGARLDDEPTELGTDARAWTRDEWAAWTAYDFREFALRGLSPEAQAAVQKAAAWKADEKGDDSWALSWAKAGENDVMPADMADDVKEQVRGNRAKLEKRVDVARSIVLGTNVPDSLTAVVNREQGNMPRGVIVFSDGRSNLGSDAAYAELAKRAREANVPVVTVAVGEPREVVALTITDLQVPDRLQPEEPTKVVIEADGVGFKPGDKVTVLLDLFLPGKDTKKDQPDYTTPLELAFGPGDPPHGQAEFNLDADKLHDVAPTLVEESKKVGRKWQLRSGEWHVAARIQRDKREIFADDYHLSPVRAVQVIDKPVRVLLVTSGGNREYQTLRALLVRESSQKRAEVSIYFQNEGGVKGEIVQDVPPERLLTRFPDKLDTTGKAAPEVKDTDPGAAAKVQSERFYNLAEYDVVVAFDPDWNEKDAAGQYRISEATFKNLESWVTNAGGGLIYVAGPIHTFQLARTDDAGRLAPLRNLLPVFPDDSVLIKSRGIPKTPRRLKFSPKADLDLLRIDEQMQLDDASTATAGWERFFTGRDKFAASGIPGQDAAPPRGFFSYYPVKDVKKGATTFAQFLDVENGQEVLKPYFCVAEAGGRTAWIGSGESYRLRQTDFGYFDRFWLKLLRYGGAKRGVNPSRGQVLMSKEFVSGGPVRVQARVLAENTKPYTADFEPPKFRVLRVPVNGDRPTPVGVFPTKVRKSGDVFDGYYTGQINADPKLFPVDGYRYQVVIDDADNNGRYHLNDPLTAEFILRKSDPELDNTKPDLGAMQTMAGAVSEVATRIADANQRQEALKALLNVPDATKTDLTKTKLAFRLTDTEQLAAMPQFMDAKSQSFRNKGAVDDLWDDPLPTPDPLVNLLRTPLVGTSAVTVRLWVPVAAVLMLLVAAGLLVRRNVIAPWLGTVLTLAVLLFITLTAVTAFLGNQPFAVGWAVAVVVAALALEWTTRKLIRLA